MESRCCDYCGSAIKDKEYYRIATMDMSVEVPTDYNAYNEFITNLQKKCLDMCPTCKKILDEMYRLRVQNLNEIDRELLGTYKLESKANPAERKNRRKK